VKIVSVINYKGGVGKTTLTANLGAELAFRGRSVLLVDVDPQASLTFSLYPEEDWSRDLAPQRTIKTWFDALVNDRTSVLADVVSTPPLVASLVTPVDGRLDLVASHLDLIDIDFFLAAKLGGGILPEQIRDNYLRLHRCLANGFSQPDLQGYDFILIDCAPNFGVVTRTAIVASDHVLIPAKADDLSTLGIPTLRKHIEKLTKDFNTFLKMPGTFDSMAKPIDPAILGVVFTMVGLRRGVPYQALQSAIAKARTWANVFDSMVRENKSAYANAVRRKIPVALAGVGGPDIVRDIEGVTDEFLNRIEGDRR
jgi:chromosome partitioning protein